MQLLIFTLQTVLIKGFLIKRINVKEKLLMKINYTKFSANCHIIVILSIQFFILKFILRCIICERFKFYLDAIKLSANCGDPDDAECQRWPNVFCHWNYQIQKQCPHRCNLCPTQ